MTVALMTVAEYARHRACDEKAVRKALEEKRISRIGTERRCIDPKVADIQWSQNTRARTRPANAAAGVAAPQVALVAPEAPQQPATPPVAAEPGYQDHRARRELADAERAEIETARMAGRLVDRERGERAVFEAFRELRDAVMAATKSQAHRVLGMTDLREIELTLEEEARTAFADWDTRMRRRIQDAVAT